MLEPETVLSHPRVISRAEWLPLRQELLREEKELTRGRDELARRRRDLPWVRLEKPYAFEGAGGRATLGDLFGTRSQLIVYHFMLGPGWEEGCKSCSLLADHFDRSVVHLNARDISFAAISLAPWPEIRAFQARMGWTFRWLSSHGSEFNRDFHVSFTPDEIACGPVYYNYAMQEFPIEEAPGLSVFAKDERGAIFHTYSTYSRGLDPLIGAYQLIDLTPKGRNEDPDATMAWVRHHDRY